MRPRASTSSSSPTASIPPRPLHSLAGNGSGAVAARNRFSAASEWICQFVGFSGDQDPFVLRYVLFSVD